MSNIIEQEQSPTTATPPAPLTTPERAEREVRATNGSESAKTGFSQAALPAGPAAASPTARPAHVKKPTKGRIFRRTGYTRAVIEGIFIFAAYRLLVMVPANDWPGGAALIGMMCLVLLLHFAPPVWAAMRVVSTKREKMSRRFWKMGPILAGLCLLLDIVVALGLGQPDPLIGPDGKGPVWQRLTESGAAHLSLATFAINALSTLAFLVIYFTIAVVCTRLANGGMLRFTMPSGNGRVTL